MKQTNLASLMWFREDFKKKGIDLKSHKFCKNQQIIKYVDPKGRHITKQLFNPDEWGRQKVIVRCKEGIPFREVFK